MGPRTTMISIALAAAVLAGCTSTPAQKPRGAARSTRSTAMGKA